MSLNHHLPKKISLKPQKHHGFNVLIFICGFFLPPIALRFGFGTDFLVNCILCILGYFPSHGHNFYIQNIRNNENKSRTPKWVRKAGLVDPSEQIRREKKNEWKKRYDERNTQSTHVGAQLEEGEVGDNYIPESDEAIAARERRRNEGLWGRDDEEFYNEDAAPNQRHWHYPANFEGTDIADDDRGRASGSGGRRDDSPSRRSVDSITGASAYPTRGATDNDVPEWGRDYGAKKKPSKKGFGLGKKKKNVVIDDYVNGGTGGGGNRNGWANDGYADEVEREDGWGRATPRPNGDSRAVASGGGSKPGRNGDPNWEHEF